MNNTNIANDLPQESSKASAFQWTLWSWSLVTKNAYNLRVLFTGHYELRSFSPLLETKDSPFVPDNPENFKAYEARSAKLFPVKGTESVYTSSFSYPYLRDFIVFAFLYLRAFLRKAVIGTALSLGFIISTITALATTFFFGAIEGTAAIASSVFSFITTVYQAILTGLSLLLSFIKGVYQQIVALVSLVFSFIGIVYQRIATFIFPLLSFLRKIYSADYRTLAIFEEVQSKGHDLNTELNENDQKLFPDEISYLPIHIAVTHGYLKTLEFLARAGADLNKPQINRITPLMVATEKGHIDVIKFLLEQEKKINIDARSIKEGWTAVYLAAFDGRVEIVKLLAQAGAKLDLPQSQRFTPLMVAAEKGHNDVVEFLLGHKDTININAQNKDNATAVYLAAQNNHVEALKLLAKAGANLDLTQNQGFTPLIVAAEKGHTDVVDSLLGHKDRININAQQEENGTAVFFASQNNQVKALKLLAKAGADLNMPDKNG